MEIRDLHDHIIYCNLLGAQLAESDIDELDQEDFKMSWAAEILRIAKSSPTEPDFLRFLTAIEIYTSYDFKARFVMKIVENTDLSKTKSIGVTT